MVNIIKHKWQKIVAAVLLVFIIVICAMAGVVNRYWSPILAQNVKIAVLASTDSLYEADFRDADFHVLQGKLVIHDITLRPNMALYKRIVKTGIAPNNLYELKVKRLVIKHMHPIRLYFKRELNIDQIILSAPELRITYHLNHTHDTLPKDRLTAWQRIRPMLKSLDVKQIMLNDVKLKYEDYSGNTLDISELKEMNLTGNNLLIDSLTQTDRSRFYYFKEVQLELNNFSRISKDSLYTYQIRQLQYSTLTSRLQAFGVGVVPVKELVFMEKKIRNRYSFFADTLRMDNFDFSNYNKYRRFNSSKLVLSKGEFTVFTNPAAPVRKGNRLRTFPNVAIRQIKNDVKLDTLQLRQFNITYRGYGKKSKKPGHISFNNTNGFIFNITNNEAALQRNPVCRLTLNTRVMNAGRLDLGASFNLTDSARSYTYSGTLGTMKMGKLNPATQPFGLVKITSGTLNRFNFDITGNSRLARGKITLLYNDLKIKLFKADSIHYMRRPMVTLMANALIIKHHNPDKPGDAPRSYEVSYIREPDTPFLKAVWQTLAQGIKASAGYDDATERKVKQHIAQFTIDRRNRQIRKELRHKRREARKHKH